MGGFSGKRYIGDIELWLRLAQRYPMVKFQGDLYWSRVHANSEGSYEQKENTVRMRKELIESYLTSPLCPILPAEIRSTFRQRIKRSVKRFFKLGIHLSTSIKQGLLHKRSQALKYFQKTKRTNE